MNVAEQQIDQLHDFLAQYMRPAGLTISQFVTREAAAGNLAAKRLIACGIFNGAGDVDTVPATPSVPPAVLERDRREASQQLPTARELNPRHLRRPVVHSGVSKPWL